MENKRAIQLKNKADALRRKVESLLEPRLENTPKRRQAAEARRDAAVTLSVVAGALESLASHWENSTIYDPLKPIKTVEHVRYLVEFDAPRGFRLTRGDIEALLSLEVVQNELDPRSREEMASGQSSSILFRPSIELAKKLVAFAKKHKAVYDALPVNSVEGTKLSLDLGVYDDKRFALVKKLLMASINEETMSDIQRLKSALDLKKKLNLIEDWKPEGYWSTPDRVAEELADKLGIEPRHQVLEPSAGTGNLAKAALRRGAFVFAIEKYDLMCEYMNSALQGPIQVICEDFLEAELPMNTYDRILMNPPSRRGQDALHVMHAYKFLKPGGRMLAIISAGVLDAKDKISVTFQDFLKNFGATLTRRDDIFHATVFVVIIEKPR